MSIDVDNVAKSTKGRGADDPMDYHDEGLSFISDRLGSLSFVDKEMDVDVCAPPPVFCAQVIDEQEHHAEIEPSEQDANMSFDFAGEIKKLKKSDDSDRHRFVEQLENVFRTPAKIDVLRLCRAYQGWFLTSRHPSCFTSPTALNGAKKVLSGMNTAPRRAPLALVHYYRRHSFPAKDAFLNFRSRCQKGWAGSARTSYSASRQSDGELDKSFTFRRSRYPHLHTLVHCMGNLREDDSVLQSILAKALEVPRLRVYSDSSSKRASRAHGLDTFGEVRRGFEFPDNRPTFYPPSETYSRPNRQETAMGFASVSSYGRVVNAGVVDPCLAEAGMNDQSPSGQSWTSTSHRAAEAKEGAVKARIVVKPSIASAVESNNFGGERMIRTQHGLLDRRSLEESCLVAEGEDMSFSGRCDCLCQTGSFISVKVKHIYLNFWDIRLGYPSSVAF
ncbi:hypothetical protein EDD18DRAFT_1407512 [Armillaria luteobubalina]|uniref:Uncharacterized protein n=1 Tax=Armillaria luteobubalina TaxID=153913 RepID=A0AA39Q0L7_9AGAR|nr:hypothetical protein EDD18DRAFT_1407512 [Armillaria luteobubalina]